MKIGEKHQRTKTKKAKSIRKQQKKKEKKDDQKKVEKHYKKNRFNIRYGFFNKRYSSNPCFH